MNRTPTIGTPSPRLRGLFPKWERSLVLIYHHETMGMDGSGLKGNGCRGRMCWGCTGFVAPGGFIITAAHCIRRLPKDYQPGDPVEVQVQSVGEMRPLRATSLLHCAEIGSDWAILSDKTFSGTELSPEGMKAFERLIDSRRTAPIEYKRPEPPKRNSVNTPSTRPPPPSPFAVHIRTIEGKWISGIHEDGQVTLAMGTPGTTPGTSGSPAFNDSGRVVGILSRGAICGRSTKGRVAHISNPIPPTAELVSLQSNLPPWYLRILEWEQLQNDR